MKTLILAAALYLLPVQSGGSHCGVVAADMPRAPATQCPAGQSHNQHCLDKAKAERRNAVFAAYEDACAAEGLADDAFDVCSGHAENQYDRCIANGGAQIVCTQILVTYLQYCVDTRAVAYGEADAQCLVSVGEADDIFAAAARACCQKP